MSTRTVLVRVTADTAGFTGPLRGATAAADSFGAAATRSGAGVRGLTDETTRARTGLTGVNDGAARARTGLTGVTGAADGAARGIRGITGTAPGVTGAFSRIGSVGSSAFTMIRNTASRAASMAGELGIILAGGEIYRGLKEIVEQGNEFNDSLNKFQEVTRGTGAQMRAASTEAQALGADLKLPQASAAEAADAMVELAKAGLSAQDAITATKGTIELASAARTDVATAAKIEGDALDQFGLKAKDATTVADTLANVANNTSGELTDLAYALKYVGPTAHSMGISIQDATTAIGLLGKSGIIGETAGTALRSALVNMSKPTAQMKKGLAELGIQAYDSQGNFKGLEYVVGKLADAQGHLTTQQFTSAAAMAFGKPALSAMTALAHQGTQNFDSMATAINRQGGAAALAAAESKGLGGAMRGLGKELSSTFLQLYLAVSPSLEKITRGMSAAVADGLPELKRGIKTAEDLWTIYGPTVEAKLSSAAHGVEAAASSMVKPVETAVTDVVTATVPLAATVGEDVVKAFDNAKNAAQPVVSGVEKIASSVTKSGGALDVFDGRLTTGVGLLQKVAGAAGDLTNVLGPIGSLVGGVAKGFSALPGSIQLSVLGMIALRPFRSQIQGLQSTVVGYGRSAVTSFNGVRGAMETQRVLASQAGVSLGRWGSALAAVEARSPGIRAMGEAFRGVTSQLPETATGVQRIGANLRGISAAGAVGALNGLKSAGKGLLSVMGGPWGLALTGAFTLMDVFAQHQQAAKQAVEDFTSSIQQDSGALGQNTQALLAQKLQQSGAFDTAQKYGIAVGTVQKAALGNKDALNQVNTALQKNATYAGFSSKAATEAGKSHLMMRDDAQDLLKTLNGTSTSVGKAVTAYRNEANATKDAGTAAGNATDPTSQLQGAINTLADSASDADTKATALHNALDLLSGGELDVQAAMAQMNQSIIDLNDSYKDGVTKADGYGKALLQNDGSLKTTTKNGQNLWNLLQNLNSSTAGAAESAYTFARANGTSVPDALKQAEAAMQTSYDKAVQAGRGFGLSATAAQKLADTMGFIPSNLALTIDTKDIPETTRDLLYVQGLAGHVPTGKTITVSALTAEAVKDLEAVGVTVQKVPGGRLMKITAPTAQAQAALDQLIAKKIPGKTVQVDAATAKAISQLQAVQSKVASTKGKSITVDALTGTALKALENVGFKVKSLPNHKVSITAPTGSAISNVGKLQSAINGLHGRSVTNTVTTSFRTNGKPAPGPWASGYVFNARGSVTDYYANGGIRAYAGGGMEQHIAQIAPAGAMRLWAEPETGGEAYIPLAQSKRSRSRAIADETVRRLGGKGIAWAQGGLAFADGGFTYAPTTPADTLGATSGMDRYTAALQKLTDATSQLKDATTKSQKAAAHRAINSADAALGLKAGTTSTAFNLKSYQKELAAAASANKSWEANLAKIGAKAGADVEDTLRSMGSDGTSLVSALAKASSSQFKSIVANLKALAPTAAATLADYTKQLSAANSASSTFQNNLLKLTSMGYGDLATQLAAQGDDAAQAVAAAAVKSSSAASSANKAAKANAGLLSSDDLTNAMTLLSFLRSHPGAGISDVLADGLDWDTVSALAPKIKTQLESMAGATSFVQQLRGQGIAMAKGGIAPDGAHVTFAEKGTGGEAFIPLGTSNRSRSTGLLSSVAGMFGYQLTPVGVPSRPANGTGRGGDYRSYSITLYGAKQSSAEQASDLMRRMSFIG